MTRPVLILLVCAAVLTAFIVGCGDPGQREFAEGLKELENGNYPRAKLLLEKSISKRPASEENALAFNYLGIASARLGQLDRAIDEFEESRRRNAALFEPTYNLAVLMYEGGGDDRATALLEEAAAVDLDDTRALEYLGHIYLERGDGPEARRVLYQALERAPHAASVLTAIASAELRTEGPDAAVAFLMRALESQADYPPALYNLAAVYMQQPGRARKAAAFFRKYIERVPDGPLADRARTQLAGLETKPSPAPPGAGRAPEAAPQPAPEERADTSGGEPDQLLLDARIAASAGEGGKALRLCLQAAAIAARGGDKSRAEEALQLATELCPDRAEAHYEYARWLREEGRHEVALAEFKKALTIRPTWDLAYLGLATAAIQTGEIDAALVALKQVVRLKPENADALWALAMLYDRHLGLPEQAVAAYRDFERLFPNDPRIVRARERLASLTLAAAGPATPAPVPAATPAPGPTPGGPLLSRRLEIKRPLTRQTRAAVQAYNRGTIYQEREDWDRAIYYYTRALENDDTFANAYYNLGTVYRANGDLDLAKDAYLYAIQLQPDMINARYNLALAYMELRSDTAAVEQLQAVLELQPNYTLGHHALGLIYARDPRTADRARTHFQKFLELAPNDPSAPSVRDWLRTH